MVDLYRVVRESVRVGEPGYSIKNLERFYMPARTTAVASGGDSLVIYDRFRETSESSLLNDLRDYNRDDCLSTLSSETGFSGAPRKRVIGRQLRTLRMMHRPEESNQRTAEGGA